MCSITAGFDTDEVRELVELNKTRGTHSHSIFYISVDTYTLIDGVRAMGEININNIDIPENTFCIIHQQAPTTDAKNITSVHPSFLRGEGYTDSYLWHNGIIKQNCIEGLKQRYFIPKDVVWDTAVIHHHFDQTVNMEGVDGSFACINYISGNSISVFRNEIAPLFVSDSAISSTSFPGSTSLKPNTIFDVYLEDSGIDLMQVDTFKTVNNPYYFGE